MRNEEVENFQALIQAWRGARKQQHHPGDEHQQSQDRRRQATRRADGLACVDQPAQFHGQQQQAGHQQWQHDIDEAIEQQGGGKGRGTQFVGEGCQQYRLEYADTARHMAEHAGCQCQ